MEKSKMQNLDTVDSDNGSDYFRSCFPESALKFTTPAQNPEPTSPPEYCRNSGEDSDGGSQTEFKIVTVCTRNRGKMSFS